MVPWLGMGATSQPVMQDANEFFKKCFKTVYQCIPYVACYKHLVTFLAFTAWKWGTKSKTMHTLVTTYLVLPLQPWMKSLRQTNCPRNTHITNIACIVSKFKLPFWKSSMILILLTTAGSWRNGVFGAMDLLLAKPHLGFQLTPSRKASLAHLYLKQKQQHAQKHGSDKQRDKHWHRMM